MARALQSVATERDPLVVGARLRNELSGELARRAALLHELRVRSERSYPGLRPLYMTRQGLEQATPEGVALWRARAVAEECPGASIWDATCGIGVDTLALAGAGVKGLASDCDFLHAKCARSNLASLCIDGRVVVADARHFRPRADLVLLDPDRRASGTRTLDPERWSPSLGETLAIADRHGGSIVKLPPAFDPERSAQDVRSACWRWVSVGRELAEVSLWLGALAPPDASEEDPPVVREAVAIDREGRVSTFRARPVETAPCSEEELDGLGWIADPDPSIVRSRLLGALAREQGLRPLDRHVAYLGGEGRPRSPLLRALRVVDAAPLDRRRVRAMLARHDVGPVQVRKRGHSDPAEVLARRFAGKGERRGHLVVARIGRGHRAFLVEEPATAPEAAPPASDPGGAGHGSPASGRPDASS